jgi:hypothetical protein
MADTTTDNLLARLEGLTNSEKLELRKRIDFELSQTKSPFSAAEDETWAALAAVCQATIRLPMFTKRYGRAKYADASAMLHAYVQQYCGELSRPVRVALLTRLLRCLRLYLTSHQMEPTPAAVLDQLGRLAWAVEQQFPGYTAAGMLHKLGQQRSAVA